LITTTDRHLVALSLTGPRVSLEWHGPAYADLTIEEAQILGYLLRCYARLANTANDPGE
jgi:hypothetical protein